MASRYYSHRSVNFFRLFLTLSLISILLLGAVPSSLAAAGIRQAAGFVSSSATRAVEESGRFVSSVTGRINTSQRQGMPPRQIVQGVKPRAVPTKAEHEARAVSLRISPEGELTLRSREPVLFAATPLDGEGNPVHGVHADWASSDKQVVFISKQGRAIAGKPGTAVLTARVGRASQSVRITVVDGTGEQFGGKKKEDSQRGQRPAPGRSTGINTNLRSLRSGLKRQHAMAGSMMTGTTGQELSKKSMAFRPMPLRAPSDDPLPDGETGSLYAPENLVGAPPGRTIHGANTAAAATGGTEGGISNFTFGLPIASLPGRGIDASVSLVYNSQVWNKSTSSGSTYLTYDVDSDWPSPGFRIGFGQIEDQGSNGFTLTDQDGTRHALTYTSTNNYDTTDGSHIHFTIGIGLKTVYYSDGTRVSYGAAGGGYRSYPIQITDRNGNYLTITYVGNTGPKIDTIIDTLERHITFHYAAGGDLVCIKAPGLGTTDRQMMRFYYRSTDINLNSTALSTLFDSSSVIADAPPGGVAHVLESVYLPSSSDGSNAHIGYKFDYSAYGMIYQMTQFRGMTVSSTSETTAGTVSTNGTLAASTTYDYPTSAVSSGLTNAPTYGKRTDEWAGRTSGMSGTGAAPYFTFVPGSGSGVLTSTVTAPDGTVTQTDTIDNPGAWNDGLISDTYVKADSSTTLSHTKMDWDNSSGNPRISQVRLTDEAAGLTKATVLSYTTYDNVSAVSERAFTTDGTVSATELRRTETTYVTTSDYTNQYLLHLPSMVKVFPGGFSTAASRVDYAYDNYGTSHVDMTSRDDIVMHDPAYDPFQPVDDNCDWACTRWEYVNDILECTNTEYICNPTTAYIASTDYRGNVTSVTTYPDATTTTGAITHSTTYDIAGNVTSAEVDCCHKKTINYTTGDHYAYPASVTSGDPSGLHLTQSATYDLNTGLVATTTDENGQVTTNYYNGDSLRLNHVDRPSGGGSTYFYYDNSLIPDAHGNNHFYTNVSTKLDSTNWADVYNFYDGRGAVSQTFYDGTGGGPWTTQLTEYDVMGRAYRASTPFANGGYGDVLIPSGLSAGGFWITETFDHLGRVTGASMPSGDDANPASISAVFDGVYTTVTDQAGKQRRYKVDELGRVIRLDEPTTSGSPATTSLGTVSSPNQATSYTYDVLNNLVKVTQGVQARYFKYDSLSRLIRENQVEQATNSTYDLSDSVNTSGTWTRKIVYNSSGLVSESHDARGVQSTLSYDDLNRLTTVAYSDSTPAVHYYYDAQTLPSGAPSYTHGYSTGRLLAATYGSGATGTYLGYDNLGRVVTQKQVTGTTPTSYTLGYSYNYAGMLTSETYPSNRGLTYSYGYGGKLASVSDGTTTFTGSMSYAANGGLSSETFGNTAVHTVDYNHAMQASQVKLTIGSSVLQQYDYSYGTFNTSTGAVDQSKNNGQIGKVDGTIGTTTQWSQGFTYDELGRLSNAAEYQGGSMGSQTWSQGYTYDRFGNRFQSANSTLGLPAVSSSEIVNTTNRFVNSGPTPTTYDAAGNITNDTKFRGLSYAYDANGRQKSASNGTWTDSQVYDAAGQRVQTSASGVTRTQVYDIFGQNVAEYTGSTGGTLESENIYRGGQLLATVASTVEMSIGNFGFETPNQSGGYQYNPSGGSWSFTSGSGVSGNNSGFTSGNPGAPEGDQVGFIQGAAVNAAITQSVTGFVSGVSYKVKFSAAQRGNCCGAGGEDFQVYLDGTLLGTFRPSGTSYDEYSTGTFTTTTGSHTLKFVGLNSLGGDNAALIDNVHVTGALSGNETTYVLQDVQGSTRAIMNNNGSSSSVTLRHDYLPFGEEIGVLGSRTVGQGYNLADMNRQKYAQLERDGTGLDNSWFRKYENLSGRWTSPDPYSESMSIGSPQSFNRYSYTQNDPVNFVDPSGLLMQVCHSWTTEIDTPEQKIIQNHEECYIIGGIGGGWGSLPGGSGDPIGGGGPGPGDGGPGEVDADTDPKDTSSKLEDADAKKETCKQLARAIKGAIRQAQRHLDNYGTDFEKWKADAPPFNYLTGQLGDYQRHVDNAQDLTEQYKKECSDFDPPPQSPAFNDIPDSIPFSGKPRHQRRALIKRLSTPYISAPAQTILPGGKKHPWLEIPIL